MIVIPALDLTPDTSRSPAAALTDRILSWERDGFTRVHLHIRSHADHTAGLRLVEDAIRDVHCAVQVAGRFDTSEDIEVALSCGATAVVLGARALDELDWLSSAANRFPEQLIVSAPARERRARTRGAIRTLPVDLRDLAAEIASLPLTALLVEFPSDAAIGHPDLALLEDVAEEVPFPVQVTGGSPDLTLLRDCEFRGVGATLIDATHLSAAFDEQTLARSFSD